MSLATRPAWRAETGTLAASLGHGDVLISFPQEGTARICLHPAGERPAPTPAIVDPAGAGLPFRVREATTGLIVEGPGIRLGVRLIQAHTADSGDGAEPHARAPLIAVEVEAGGEAASLAFHPVPEGWEVVMPLHAADRCLGLGEKTGYLDRRGRSYTMWNTDDGRPHLETLDPMYVSIPWLIHVDATGAARGFYLDDPGKTTWDVGSADPAAIRVATPRPAVDLYVLAGPRLGDLTRRFTALTGRMALPPRWALGYQQCRYSYMSSDRVREVAAEFRRREIPCDVLYLDIDYMDGYRVFTWDPDRFGDAPALHRELESLGFRTVTIVDPGVKKEAGYAVFDDGLARDAFVRDADGIPYVGEVWPGAVVFPDFSRADVRLWWGEQHRALFEAGVSGIWNDMNEPADFSREPEKTLPADALHGGGLRHADVHNLYGLYMSWATNDALRRDRPGERPFVLSRAGFAGIQRYAALWTGDNFSVWAHLEQALPMAMHLGLSGVGFVGPDVGGFSGDGQGELLARWTQLGSVMPFFRNHSSKGTRDQEPWAFGPAIEEICRRYIRLRYELLPYLYTLFRQCAQDGTPILRPLAFEFPDDPEAWPISDQAMVGPDLMVCPVVRPGATRRAVYFPDGDWYDVWTGARFCGPDWRVARGDLATLPLFARAGAVLPRGTWGASTARQPRDRLILEVYPGPELAGAWYDDDGASFGHEEGAYALWSFRGGPDGAALRLTLERVHAGHASPEQRVQVMVRAVAVATGVTFGGQPVDWRLEGGDLVAEGPLAPGEWRFEGVGCA